MKWFIILWICCNMVEHEDLEVGCKCSRYRVLLLIDSFVLRSLHTVWYI